MVGNPEMGGGRAKSGSKERGIQGAGRTFDRPRTNDDGNDGSGGGGDPTAQEKGLMENITDTLDEWSKDIQDEFAGTPGDDRIISPQERAGFRPPNDERPPRPPLRPPEEDEPIIPGDPNDLGARGRRRGTRDDVNASPVLRRGLLGV